MLQDNTSPDEWIDVRIRSNADAGELLGLLDDPDVQGAWQDGETVHLYWPSHSWSRECLTRLHQALRQLDGEGQSLPEVLVESLPHLDWNRLWAESVKPVSIGRRVVIRPSWEPVTVRSDQIEIILDPKQAFGTGHHATTRMLLEWLEELIGGGESVLDVGTGSAVLAMVALRLGAARATSLDNDPVAIECAEEYARENRFGKELMLRCGTLYKGEMFDLVLANLDRRTLLLLADDLTASTQGTLLISGLLVEQRQDIVEAFGRLEFYPRAEREMAGWLAVALGRAQGCEEAER